MRKALTMILVFVLAMSLTACGGGSKSSEKPSAGEAPKAPEEILIGNLQDTSGPTSVWGKAVTIGIEMAIKKINDHGGINGKQLKLISYDTKNDVQEAINAYNRLVTSDKVVAIAGPPISNIGIALAPITEEKKVPFVGSFIDERATTKPDGTPYTYMFLVQPSSSQQAQIMAGYAMEKVGLKKFAVLYNQANSYSVSLSKPFIEYVKSHGGEVVIEETYKSGDKDFKTQLAKIKNTKPDAIYAPNYVQELTLIVQQARALGIELPIVGGLDAAPPFASLAGEAANKVLFPNNFAYDEPQLKEVYDAYKAKYSEEPLNKVFLGYDTMLVIAEAIKKAGSTDSTKIAEAAATLKDVQGTTGTISISSKTHRPYGLSMVMFEIDNGKYIAKERYLTKELQQE